MLALGPIAFASPWILAALITLPAIWWLLRLTPPPPRRVSFPPVRLLHDLAPREETAAQTPLWLLLARFLLAALLILALARPLWHPQNWFSGDGPLVLAIDDGWAAAKDWPKRQSLALGLIDQAEREARPVMVIATAPEAGASAALPRLQSAADARASVTALAPKPWNADRRAAMHALDSALGLGLLPARSEAVWLTDGIDDRADQAAATLFAEKLASLGQLQIVAPARAQLPHLMRAPRLETGGTSVPLSRATAGEAENVFVLATAEDGRTLARRQTTFEPGQKDASALLELPIEIRNEIARLEIEGESSAGATVLLDERWRQRPVGMVGGGGAEARQPLLSELYYLERALKPFTDVRSGSISELLERELAVLILADVGTITPEARARIDPWIEAGGVLVRFAGPRFAASDTDLTPVLLRGTARQLGGALSWSEPAALAPFPGNSPFAGLIRPGDVAVRRQVLAEPGLELAAKTWAELDDGTPLVTADRRGQGWVVLFHTTANTEWSNLALSGVFVDMLRRIVDLSQGVGSEPAGGEGVLAPYLLLDGFARLSGDLADARPIENEAFATLTPGPKHPPGYYGNAQFRRALNLGERIPGFSAIDLWPGAAGQRDYESAREIDLGPPALALALLGALGDLILAFYLLGYFSDIFSAGNMRRRRPSGLFPGLILAATLLGIPPAFAQQQGSGSADLGFAIEAAKELRLAYVLTGVGPVDAMSRAGLVGLGEALYRRSSVEPGAPIGVDLERHDLAFFPMLYWPATAEQRPMSAQALARLERFLKTGGLLVVDTRDGPPSPGAHSPSGNAQRRAFGEWLTKLDIGPLVPLPTEHVLTKSFYLLREFPGRHAGGKIWVEQHQGGVTDGVSALVVGGNDWASAWAIDGRGEPLVALSGGIRQRESAYRFGVNLVMYALTGNYKADQVHVPALLERLGQ